jgi:hypothetical protein
MRQRYFSLLFAIATSSLVLFTTVACKHKTSLPVVQIDNEHYLWREDNKPYLVYRVAAGNELILDATGYEFDTSKFASNFDPQRGWYSDVDLSPNVIQVVVELQADPAKLEDAAKGPNVYRAEWHPNSQQHDLNAQTLIPVGESAPFTKTESGQRILIEIGHLEKEESTNKEVFYSFWSGMIEIQ